MAYYSQQPGNPAYGAGYGAVPNPQMMPAGYPQAPSPQQPQQAHHPPPMHQPQPPFNATPQQQPMGYAPPQAFPYADPRFPAGAAYAGYPPQAMPQGPYGNAMAPSPHGFVPPTHMQHPQQPQQLHQQPPPNAAQPNFYGAFPPTGQDVAAAAMPPPSTPASGHSMGMSPPNMSMAGVPTPGMNAAAINASGMGNPSMTAAGLPMQPNTPVSKPSQAGFPAHMRTASQQMQPASPGFAPNPTSFSPNATPMTNPTPPAPQSGGSQFSRPPEQSPAMSNAPNANLTNGPVSNIAGSPSQPANSILPGAGGRAQATPPQRPILQPPLPPEQAKRESERVAALLAINSALLQELCVLQAAGRTAPVNSRSGTEGPGQNSPTASASGAADGQKDNTNTATSVDGEAKDGASADATHGTPNEKKKAITSREYVECMRRLQANLSWLSIIADRPHKPIDKIPDRPAIMDALPPIPGTMMGEESQQRLRSLYQDLRNLWPPSTAPPAGAPAAANATSAATNALTNASTNVSTNASTNISMNTTAKESETATSLSSAGTPVHTAAS